MARGSGLLPFWVQLFLGDALYVKDLSMIFVHIPKSGGSAIEETLGQQYGLNFPVCSSWPEQCSATGKDHPAPGGRTKVLWGSYVHTTDAMARCALRTCGQMQSCAWPTCDDCRVSDGHVVVGKLDSFAVLRNPIERLVSSWAHRVDKEGYESDVEEYVLGAKNAMLQGSFGIRQCEFVKPAACSHPSAAKGRSITSLFAYSGNLSGSAVGDYLRSRAPDLKIRMINVAAANKPPVYLSAEAVARIQEVYAADFELWLSVEGEMSESSILRRQINFGDLPTSWTCKYLKHHDAPDWRCAPDVSGVAYSGTSLRWVKSTPASGHRHITP